MSRRDSKNHQLHNDLSTRFAEHPSKKMGDVLILIEVWLWTLAALVYVYMVVSRLPTTLSRLIASLPIVYLFLTLPRRFSSVNLIGISFFYLSWLSNFKIVLFCFDRGPLVPLHGSLLSFLSFAALPIRPKRTDQTQTNKTQKHHCVGKALMRTLLAATLVVPIVKVSVSERVPRHGLARPVLYTVLLLTFMEALFSATSIPARLLPGVELEPQFDQPYLSDSLADFWGRRWNLIVTNILRPAVYWPVRSACLGVLGSRPARLVGILATFLVSGIMHEVILWYESAAPPTWEWFGFFVLHGFLTAGEAWLGWVLPLLAKRLPRPVKVVFTLGMLFSTALWLFFPPIIRCGLDAKLLQEINYFIDVLDVRSVLSSSPNALSKSSSY